MARELVLFDGHRSHVQPGRGHDREGPAGPHRLLTGSQRDVVASIEFLRDTAEVRSDLCTTLGPLRLKKDFFWPTTVRSRHRRINGGAGNQSLPEEARHVPVSNPFGI